MNLKPPIFDNIRWGEFIAWLAAVSAILELVERLPISANYKHLLSVGIAVLSYILSYLRNPKTLAWINSGFRGIPPAPPGYTKDIRTDRSDEI